MVQSVSVSGTHPQVPFVVGFKDTPNKPHIGMVPDDTELTRNAFIYFEWTDWRDVYKAWTLKLDSISVGCSTSIIIIIIIIIIGFQCSLIDQIINVNSNLK